MKVIIAVTIAVLIFCVGGLICCGIYALTKDMRGIRSSRKSKPKGPNPYDIDLEKYRPNVLGSEIRRV